MCPSPDSLVKHCTPAQTKKGVPEPERHALAEMPARGTAGPRPLHCCGSRSRPSAPPAAPGSRRCRRPGPACSTAPGAAPSAPGPPLCACWQDIMPCLAVAGRTCYVRLKVKSTYTHAAQTHQREAVKVCAQVCTRETLWLLAMGVTCTGKGMTVA